MKVFRGKLESACLSIHVSVCQSVCVQNTSVCQSTGGGIKSHLVRALVGTVLQFVIFLIFQIVNLKRFQYLNGRWVKSHKIVNFPLLGFNPSCYLAPRQHSLCKCCNPSSQSDSGCQGDTTPTAEKEADNVTPCHCDKNDPSKIFV